MNPPDHNNIKWSGFYANEQAAEECLQEKCLILSQKKLIVSAKKEFANCKSHDLLLYKFTILTADKN
jgi:hypothetical protein